jgi:integrase
MAAGNGLGKLGKRLNRFPRASPQNGVAMKLKLTARNVAKLTLPAGKAEELFFDTDLTGFAVRLRRSESGRLHRTYIAQYRSRGRKPRMTLGSYETLTFEQARAAAKANLAKVALGEDPQGEKRRQRLGAERSLKSVAESFLQMKQSTLRPNSYREARRYLLTSYFRALHAADINAIGRADVAVCLNRVVQDRGATVARAARAALSALFVWAMRQGFCEVNVVAGTEDPRPANGSRERVISDPEIVHIWNACGDCGDYGQIIRLCLLTACRRQEIGKLAWNEIDKDNGMLLLPSTRTKNGREHRLPLSSLALSILKEIPQRDGRDFLFGDRSSQGFTKWSASKVALDKRAKVRDWRTHDLRRTAATKMADLGVEVNIIENILNHHSGHRAGVAGIYNRSKYEKATRAALSIWADFVQSLVSAAANARF